MNDDILSGPVSICVDRPLLSLDRPFTYELPAELKAGVGSLVKVPFHGKAVKGWILGPTEDLPKRMLKVKAAESLVRFFDDRMLELLRWTSERYVAPLATVIARSHPPRVVSEEADLEEGGAGSSLLGRGVPTGESASLGPEDARIHPPAHLAGYRNGRGLLGMIRKGQGAFVLRPAPAEEGACALESVATCLAGGRRAIVVVPEADPLPATAVQIQARFGNRVAMFLGNQSKRARYRMWLEISAGRFDVVVGTRSSVFAPLERPGLIYVFRESHANQREERSPYFHVREVAAARARIESGVSLLAAYCPTAEAYQSDATHVGPARRTWPPVEISKPGPEGRAPRLLTALRSTSGAFLYEPLPGYGIASICKSCLQPAACAACSGVLRAESGSMRCLVCGAAGVCAACGGVVFGIRKGGAERVEEWAARATSLPVRRARADEAAAEPKPGEVTIGGPEAVKDFGAVSLGLVGVLDADLAMRRPGLVALERSLAVWMEAASWAWPNGRVIVQSKHSSEPVIQALVAGNPERFHRAQDERRRQAGFPIGFPVFRVVGDESLAGELEGLLPETLLTTTAGDETICLVTLAPDRLPVFGRTMRTLSQSGVVSRVEAEPHI